MSAKVERLLSLMQAVRFCCYSPSVFNPLEGEKVPATWECLQDDIALIRRIAPGLITYGMGDGLEQIPSVASRFSPPLPVVLGIWDITDDAEIAQAILQARRFPGSVVAICCGNEGLYFQRYSAEQLQAALHYLHSELPDLCLTSSEPLNGPQDYSLLSGFSLDFHFPTIHPWFLPQREMGQMAADWVVSQNEDLAHLSGLFTCCKETGWPSGGDPQASPELQQAFWQRILLNSARSQRCAYALFEAFDAGRWKTITNAYSVEMYWGLFDSQRNPKPVAEMLLSMNDEASASVA